jgi:hypothetical protein
MDDYNVVFTPKSFHIKIHFTNISRMHENMRVFYFLGRDTAQPINPHLPEKNKGKKPEQQSHLEEHEHRSSWQSGRSF